MVDIYFIDNDFKIRPSTCQLHLLLARYLKKKLYTILIHTECRVQYTELQIALIRF